MISQELIPLSYGRSAYNVIQGTSLETHTSLLTAEDANLINRHFDIELQLGTHGIIPDDDSPTKAYDRLCLPTQREYDAAAQVVDGLEPGDVLFTEGYGYRKQPVDTSELARLSQWQDKSGMGFVQLAAFEQARSMVADTRLKLEDDRRAYAISAWAYAEELAKLKGVRIQLADSDAFAEQSVKDYAAALGDDSIVPGARPIAETSPDFLFTQRERDACNAVKDWALAHLPADGQPPTAGRKPKLVLMFGLRHKEGLMRTFAELGLDVSLTDMEFDDQQERAKEQLGVAVDKLASVAMRAIADVTIRKSTRVVASRIGHLHASAAGNKAAGFSNWGARRETTGGDQV